MCHPVADASVVRRYSYSPLPQRMTEEATPELPQSRSLRVQVAADARPLSPNPRRNPKAATDGTPQQASRLQNSPSRPVLSPPRCPPNQAKQVMQDTMSACIRTLEEGMVAVFREQKVQAEFMSKLSARVSELEQQTVNLPTFVMPEPGGANDALENQLRDVSSELEQIKLSSSAGKAAEGDANDVSDLLTELRSERGLVADMLETIRTEKLEIIRVVHTHKLEQDAAARVRELEYLQEQANCDLELVGPSPEASSSLAAHAARLIPAAQAMGFQPLGVDDGLSFRGYRLPPGVEPPIDLGSGTEKSTDRAVPLAGSGPASGSGGIAFAAGVINLSDVAPGSVARAPSKDVWCHGPPRPTLHLAGPVYSARESFSSKAAATNSARHRSPNALMRVGNI